MVGHQRAMLKTGVQVSHVASRSERGTVMSGHSHYYVQCRLTRGSARQTAWLPEKFAAVGRTIRLTEGHWSEDGWQVAGIGTRLAEDYVRERSRDYLQTRKASDI